MNETKSYILSKYDTGLFHSTNIGETEMDQQSIIRENIKIINTITAEEYPALFRLFKRTSIRAHLIQLLEYMQERPYPREMDNAGRGYWTAAISFLCNKHGGTIEARQSHTIFLIDAGLIQRSKPNSKTRLAGMAEAYHEAVKTQKTPPSFYSVEKYTEELLNKAEVVAAHYKAHRIRMSHIKKIDVIMASGQRRANEVYADFRTISQREMQGLELAAEAIKTAIKEKGYATPEDMLFPLDGRIPWEIRRDIENRIGSVTIWAGYEYRPPQKADREKFKLNDGKWIITEKK